MKRNTSILPILVLTIAVMTLIGLLPKPTTATDLDSLAPTVWMTDEGDVMLSAQMYYPSLSDGAYMGGRPADRPAFENVSGKIIRMHYVNGESFAVVVVHSFSSESLLRHTDGTWTAKRVPGGLIYVPLSLWSFSFPDGMPVNYVGGVESAWSGNGEFLNGEIVFPAD